MKYKVNYNQDWDAEGYHTTQNINILCTPEELDILNSKAGEQQLTDGKQMLKLTTIKNLKNSIFADNPRVKDDRNTMLTITLIDNTPLHERKDLKETVLKTLKEVVESGEVDPWLKQDEIEKSWDNPNMSLNLPLSSLDDTGKENFETKLADKAQEKYNTSMYPNSSHNLPDENLNVQDTHGKLAMDSLSDKDYKRRFGRTSMPTPNQSINAKLSYNEHKEKKNSPLNETADTQWKSELKAFMNGLRSGNYFEENDTVYVQIWKSRTAKNDPRYVYFRRGDNRLHDDHFYMQDSPKLSRRTINVINNRLGWTYDESDFYEQKQRIRGIAKKICEELLVDNGEETPADNYLEGRTITLTSRGGSFTAKVIDVDRTTPDTIKLYAEIGHTSVVITLSEDEYYELVRGPHGTAHALFQAENNTLPPTDCTLRVD